jgi:hypothetical protein
LEGHLNRGFVRIHSVSASFHRAEPDFIDAKPVLSGCSGGFFHELFMLILPILDLILVDPTFVPVRKPQFDVLASVVLTIRNEHESHAAVAIQLGVGPLDALVQRCMKGSAAAEAPCQPVTQSLARRVGRRRQHKIFDLDDSSLEQEEKCIKHPPKVIEFCCLECHWNNINKYLKYYL